MNRIFPIRLLTTCKFHLKLLSKIAPKYRTNIVFSTLLIIIQFSVLQFLLLTQSCIEIKL